jgi:hypothetical protein
MATEGKNDGDDSSAHGWDLFKWNRVAKPPEAVTAAAYGILFLIFLFLAVSGVFALWQLLAPIWTGASLAPSTTGTDPGAELRGRILIIGALVAAPFGIWRLVVGHWSARAAQDQARIAQETARNTLFTKAIEQLGATRESKKTVPNVKKFVSPMESIAGATDFHDETNTVPNTEVRLGAGWKSWRATTSKYTGRLWRRFARMFERTPANQSHRPQVCRPLFLDTGGIGCLRKRPKNSRKMLAAPQLMYRRQLP